MKCAATSDLHGYLPNIETCDILFICGDISPLDIQDNIPKMKEWLTTTFLSWCAKIPAKYVVFVAGNHDWIAERCSIEMQNYGKVWRQMQIYYLKDELIEIEGIKIYGTPWCHQFGNWAFMGSDSFIESQYEKIPEDTNILITHDAPDIADYGTVTTPWNPIPKRVGNPILAKYIYNIKPKFALFGHLHSGDHHLQEINGTKMANVSLVNELYEPTGSVLYFDYE